MQVFKMFVQKKAMLRKNLTDNCTKSGMFPVSCISRKNARSICRSISKRRTTEKSAYCTFEPRRGRHAMSDSDLCDDSRVGYNTSTTNCNSATCVSLVVG